MLIELDANIGGLGDIVMAGYMASGMVDAGHEVIFYLDQGPKGACRRTGAADLITAMGFRCCVGHRGVRLGNHFSGYNYELRARGSDVKAGSLTRLEAWCGIWPFPVSPRRPTVTLRHEWTEWAAKEFEYRRGATVVLFPEASFQTRQWPINKWYDLAISLADSGCDVRSFLTEKSTQSEPFAGLPGRKYWGESIGCVLAALKWAKFVVGHDSGGIHMAGLMERPSIALCGPTVSSFAHYGTVREVRVDPEVVPCVGCHFQAPMRVSCNHGCDALQAIGSAMVSGMVTESLMEAMAAAVGGGGTDAG